MPRWEAFLWNKILEKTFCLGGVRIFFVSMRLKCLVFTRTKSLCSYHSDFVWNAKVQTGHGEKSLFWGGWCSTVAGIQRDCSTCNLVETQLDRVTVTQSGIGGSRIYREGHNSQPPVVPSNQHVYSFMKRKSKQNTPACPKLNISPSLLNKLLSYQGTGAFWEKSWTVFQQELLICSWFQPSRCI